MTKCTLFFTIIFMLSFPADHLILTSWLLLWLPLTKSPAVAAAVSTTLVSQLQKVSPDALFTLFGMLRFISIIQAYIVVTCLYETFLS